MCSHLTQGGQFWTPIPRLKGSVFHAESQKHTRFQPGQSGNPNGRSAKSRNLKTILNQVLEEAVEISVRGKLRRVPGIEALIRNTFVRSFKSDPKSFAMLLGLIKQTGYGSDAGDEPKDALDVLDYEAILAELLERKGRTSDDTPPVEEA